MSEEEYDKEFCVSCPICGTINRKVAEIDSVLYCETCHTDFYAFVEKGLCMIIPARWVEDEAFVNRMRAFVVSAGCGHGLIQYDAKAAGTYSRADTGLGRQNDLDTIRMIHRITKRGNSAEVKQKSDGTLIVYEVRKSIAIK